MFGVSVAESLRGPWVANVRGLLFIFIPSAVVVAYQEVRTPFPGFWFVVLSAVAQHVVAALIVIPLTVVMIRRFGIMPIRFSVLLWVVIGVGRGTVGGLIAERFAGIDGDFGYRIAFWIVASLIWSPLFAYTLAQFAARDELAAALREQRVLHTSEIERSRRTADEVRERLLVTTRATVEPVVREIQASLRAAARRVDPDTIGEIGARLARVSAETAELLEGPTPGSTVRHSASVRVRLAAFGSGAGLEFARPVATAVLTGLLLLPIFLPPMVRESTTNANETMIALAASLLVLALLLTAQRAARITQPIIAWAASRVAFLASGFAGTILLLAFPWGEAGEPGSRMLLAAIFPYGILVAASTVSTATGIGRSNLRIQQELQALNYETAQLQRQTDDAELTIREQVAALMHGPIQGRLSACAMALNFFSSGSTAGDLASQRTLTDTVISHLESVSAELDLLGRR